MAMRKYTRAHERNVISEARTTRTKLTPGHVVRFNYRGESVHVDRPLVFVLHPDYEGKLHGISLDYIPESTLVKLSKIVKDRITAKIQKLARIRLPLLKPDIGRPYDFYHQQLKKFINVNFPKGQSPYRTYLTGGITNLKNLDYRFKDMFIPEEFK